jgi:Sec-independent protein secretion pathway component TatC
VALKRKKEREIFFQYRSNKTRMTRATSKALLAMTLKQLREFRGYFIVVAFVIAAIVTPPDVISQLALAVPMCVLYELGILGAQWFVKKGADAAASTDA